MDLKKFIGERIKQFRTKRGMSQEELGELLDTSKQTVSRYEKGNRGADQDVLFQLSKIFNVGIDDFFPDKKEKMLLSNEYHYLPTAISAGLPIEVDGITEMEKLTIPDTVMGKWAGRRDIYISRINGDSMNKVIADGSLIAIKPITLDQLKDGDMVVFSKDYEYSVKYFKKDGDKLVFKPASHNEDHYDQTYSIDDGVEIHGKVVVYIVELD